MTDAEKAALTAAREAILKMSAEEPSFVSGSIRAAAGGYDIVLVTQHGAFRVRASQDGTVESVSEEEVH